MLRIHLAFIAVIAVASAGSARAQEGLQGVIVESFDGRALGSHLELETAVGRLTSSDRNMRIAPLNPVGAPEDLVLQLVGRRGAAGPAEGVWALPDHFAVSLNPGPLRKPPGRFRKLPAVAINTGTFPYTWGCFLLNPRPLP